MTTVFRCHCCAAPAVRPGRGTFCAAGKCLRKPPNVALVGFKTQPAVDKRHQNASEAVTNNSAEPNQQHLGLDAASTIACAELVLSPIPE